MKIKVTRVIEYVGEAEWVDHIVEISHLKKDCPYSFGHGKITLTDEKREEVEENAD